MANAGLTHLGWLDIKSRCQGDLLDILRSIGVGIIRYGTCIMDYGYWLRTVLGPELDVK